MFQVHSQHLDTGSGFHVITLKDEGGNQHLIQIAVGHDACPACGAVYPKTNLGAIDPRAMAESVRAARNASHENMLAYAKKHGVKVK